MVFKYFLSKVVWESVTINLKNLFTFSFPEDQSNPLNHMPIRKNSQYMSRRSQHSLDAYDPAAEPDLLIKSRVNANRLKSSLESLEKEQDKIFQL